MKPPPSVVMSQYACIGPAEVWIQYAPFETGPQLSRMALQESPAVVTSAPQPLVPPPPVPVPPLPVDGWQNPPMHELPEGQTTAPPHSIPVSPPVCVQAGSPPAAQLAPQLGVGQAAPQWVAGSHVKFVAALLQSALPLLATAQVGRQLRPQPPQSAVVTHFVPG